MRDGGRGNSIEIIKHQDGSEWVILNNKGKERFCGFLYLKSALKTGGFNNVEAAQNKMALHNRKIIYLSRYYGNEKPHPFDPACFIVPFQQGYR
jgi:hypothetical protein